MNENGDPAPVGDAGFGLQERWRAHPALVVACTFVSIAALIGAVWLLLPYGWGALAALAVYLLVAILVRPNPDLHDLGYMNGMVDNPFRISDDMNRALWIFKLALWPGRFVGESFRALAYLGDSPPSDSRHDEV